MEVILANIWRSKGLLSLAFTLQNVAIDYYLFLFCPAESWTVILGILTLDAGAPEDGVELHTNLPPMFFSVVQ